MGKINYKPEYCSCCGQTTTYLLPIDRCTVEIMFAIAKFISRKGINSVHPRKEMENIYLSSNQVGNLSRPRFHGLIAKVKGVSGNYCLTKKGAAFLRGEKVPKYAIISKSEKHQIGYYEPEDHMVTYKDVVEWVENINFDIVNGEVITPEEYKNRVQRSLL